MLRPTTLRDLNAAAADFVMSGAAQAVPFVTFEFVLSSLLSKFGVWNLVELRDAVGCPIVHAPPPRSGIAVVDFLWVCNEKVATFVENTLAMQFVTALRDLESSLVDFLNSFAMQQLAAVAKDSLTSSQHESDSQRNPFVARQFTDFGLGPLHSHPLIRRHFMIVDHQSESVPKNFISGAEVMTEFLNCAEKLESEGSSVRQSHKVGGHDRIDLSSSTVNAEQVEKIASMVAQQLGVPSLAHVGVVLNASAWTHASHTLRFVKKQRDAWRAQNVRAMLDGFNATATSRREDHSGSANTHNNSKSTPATQSVPRLASSTRPAVDNFTQRCREEWEKSSPYSPSFAKIRSVVCRQAQKRPPAQPNNSNSPESAPVKRPKRELSEAHNSTATQSTTQSNAHATLPRPVFDTLLDIASEYMLLQIGSRKYRSRRFAPVESEPAQEAEETQSEGNDDNTSGNSDEANEETCNRNNSIEGDCEDGNTSSAEESDSSVSSDDDTDSSDSSEEDTDTNSKDDKSSDTGKTDRVTASSDVVTLQKDAKQTMTTANHGNDGREKRRFRTLEFSFPTHGRTIASDSIRAALSPDILPWTPFQRGLTTDAGRSSNGFCMKDVGRWGEAAVYQYLVATLPDCNIEWLNREGESKASYDISVTDKVGH